MIDKVYCISLKDNDIRRNLMIDQLSNEFSDKYEIIDAYTSDNQRVINTYNNLTLKKSNIEALSQIAICYSHIKCLKKILENKYIYGAIIEDDIRIRQNTEKKIREYFINTPELSQIMQKEPCIVHICGPYNYTNKLNKFKERDNDVIVNICFYIVNYMLAKILIDNFFPIRWQFDTYVSKLCREKKIKEFVACPILAWDLSSTLYSNFWSKKDLEIRKYITSTSKIRKITELKVKSNIFFPQDNDSYDNLIFKSLLDYPKMYQKSDQNIYHYLPSYVNLKYVNNKTIVSGQGIFQINESINRPFITYFVRGPLTRNKFIESKISCPDIYIDPLIVYSKYDKIKSNNKIISINVKYLFLIDFDYHEFKDNRFIKLKNIKDHKIMDIINDIKYSDVIISNIYQILVLSTSYNKKTIPIYNNEKNFDVRFIDYLLGYKNIMHNWNISKLNYYNISDVINSAIHNENIFYPQIDYRELLIKQEKLSELVSYLNLI